MTQETLAERASLSVRAISDLERGLKATPRRETVELLAAALGLPVEELERAVARRRGARSGRSPAQLPAAPTPLVGREAEVRALTRLLRQDDTRLVTVTGPPGIGKTRLALAVAEAVAGGFPGGVVFVPLAAQRDPAQVPLNLAQALGVPRDGSGSLTERLAEELRGRQVLLLLDNFEQVLEAAPTLAELLAACPRLKLLVTSRAALQLQSEHRCALAPLGVPAPGQLPALDDLASVPAVVLFERRARAVNPHFRITPENLAAVAGICRRLDGLPLAIELASARAAVLAPEDLLERLERRLPVLTGGTRDLPERHQTLRQAIAWSYDLLNDPEQRLFRRLAVFGGGFSLAAAEAIGGADLAGGVLDLLTSLLDKHLVQAAAEPDGMRFSLLETVREFGLECLAASGELAGVAARHGEHFVQLAEAGYGRQVGSAQASWFRRLERELGNLRAAARWIVEQQDAGRAARLGLSLWRFWDRGYIVEGRAWLESFLGLPGLAAPGPARCRLLFAAGRLAYRQADYSPAAALLTECLAIARAERDDDFTASALTQLAHLAYAQGDLETAERRYAESLDIRRRAGDDARTIAVSLYGLARVHRARADYAVARALLVESLEQFQAAEDDVQIAGVLVALGLVALLEGDDEEAGGAFRESLARALKVGDRPGEAGALIGLAYAALGRGQPRRARTLLGESLALARATDGRQLVVQCLEGMAAVLAADGEGRRAWRLAAAVAAYRARAAVPQDPSERVLLARYLDPVAATLQPGERAALWATGSALTPEEALAGIEWPGVVVPLESIRANLVQYEREREVRA